MTLNRIEFATAPLAIPVAIVEFLRDTSDLVELHRVNTATTFQGFVPSDYEMVYRCLKMLFDSHLLCGERFCEWGSGLGVVASLAGMIGYESIGIEYDRELCLVAEGIRKDFDLSVELVSGSFIPQGVEDLVDDAFATFDGELALQTNPDRAYEELGYRIDDFDLIFTFPWPNDVDLTAQIFDRCAAQGAMLLVFGDINSIDLYRKI